MEALDPDLDPFVGALVAAVSKANDLCMASIEVLFEDWATAPGLHARAQVIGGEAVGRGWSVQALNDVPVKYQGRYGRCFTLVRRNGMGEGRLTALYRDQWDVPSGADTTPEAPAPQDAP
jgi:hypothetical protein